ncbi:hypothetical protein AURDEDRAFT_114389 [Auricularia subglabra TFB-10046 SS5]|nr:hypothetical protein AURDEDRAFT_114389 [Auricularia subglabra TFB-10046 SS5]
MNTALDSSQPQPKQPVHALDALLMLADTAAMAPTVPRPRPERFSSEPRRESSSDTTLSARERAQQQAQSELAHTQDHPDLPTRKPPRRKLSEILEDEHDYEDNGPLVDNAKREDPVPASSHGMSSPPSLGLLGLGAYGSSPEPEDADERPEPPVRLASPPAAIVQSRAPDTRKQSSPSAAVNSEAPSTDLPLKTNRALLDLGSPPSRSTPDDSHGARSPARSRPHPPRARTEHRRVSSRMVVQSPESGAEEYSSPHSLPAQGATPDPLPPSSPTWPVDPPSEAPAPESTAQEAPAPAPAKKKYNMSFKKNKPVDGPVPTPPPPSQAKGPEKEKTPPAKRLPSSLPPKPLAAGLPAKPPAATAAAPTPFGRQLPPEHSSRDVDPTDVLSSLLGKPKRDSGITPEQRREWDARKEADRRAREAEYAAQGPPLRMQRQMQTILQWESKFKAKRTNVSPNIVAAAFKQRWEKQHGPWMGAPSRRPQERGPPPGPHGRPLPPTPAPNDRANANSSDSSQSSQARAGWRPVANGHPPR